MLVIKGVQLVVADFKERYVSKYNSSMNTVIYYPYSEKISWTKVFTGLEEGENHPRAFNFTKSNTLGYGIIPASCACQSGQQTELLKPGGQKLF